MSHQSYTGDSFDGTDLFGFRDKRFAGGGFEHDGEFMVVLCYDCGTLAVPNGFPDR